MRGLAQPHAGSIEAEVADARDLKALLGLYPADEMVCWPVSQRVGNVKNNDPSLIEPIKRARPFPIIGGAGVALLLNVRNGRFCGYTAFYLRISMDRNSH